MILGHYDVVIGLCRSLQVVLLVMHGLAWLWVLLGHCELLRLVVDGFGWLWVVVGGFGLFLVLVCMTVNYVIDFIHCECFS